jgi:hypothetical protein
VSENQVLRKIFGLKREEELGIGENCTVRSFIICSPHQLLFE